MTGGASGGADPVAQSRWRWDVALSFARAQRDYVERVAAALKVQGVRCFYDADEQIDLWGKYLPEELPAIYGEQAATVVVFVSADYAARDWTRLERRAALDRAVRERREYVLPVRFDDTPLPGLLAGLVAIDVRGRSPLEFAGMVAAKLADLGIIGRTAESAEQAAAREAALMSLYIQANTEVLSSETETASSSSNTWIKISSDGACWMVVPDDETGELTEWSPYDPNRRWTGIWSREGDQIRVRVGRYKLTARRAAHGLYRGKEAGHFAPVDWLGGRPGRDDFVVAKIRHTGGAGTPLASGIWVKIIDQGRTFLLELEGGGVFRERPLFGGGSTWRVGTWSITPWTNALLRTEIEFGGRYYKVTARGSPSSVWTGTETRDGALNAGVLLAPVAR